MNFPVMLELLGHAALYLKTGVFSVAGEPTLRLPPLYLQKYVVLGETRFRGTQLLCPPLLLRFLGEFSSQIGRLHTLFYVSN
jgi:hypothetical protein